VNNSDKVFCISYVTFESVKEWPRILVMEIRIQLLFPKQLLTLQTNKILTLSYKWKMH